MDGSSSVTWWMGRKLVCRTCPVRTLAFSPESRRLAAGGRDDRSISVWDLSSGTRRILSSGEPDSATAFAFSPDGMLLASTSAFKRRVRLWSLATGQEHLVGSEGSRSVRSIAFSSDGLLLATADQEGMVGLWTASTGEQKARLDTRTTRIQAIAFSPDAQTLLLASGDDDHIRTWELSELFQTAEPQGF